MSYNNCCGEVSCSDVCNCIHLTSQDNTIQVNKDGCTWYLNVNPDLFAVSSDVTFNEDTRLLCVMVQGHTHCVTIPDSDDEYLVLNNKVLEIHKVDGTLVNSVDLSTVETLFTGNSNSLVITSGGVHGHDPNIELVPSIDPDNILILGSDGKPYVPALTPPIPVTVTDTDTIDLTVLGPNHIKADLIIDPSSTAPVSITPDGLKIDCCDTSLALNDYVTTAVNTNITLTLASNDLITCSGTKTYNVTSTIYGTVNISSSTTGNDIIFTPNTGYTGIAIVNYDVTCDGNVIASATAYIRVIVPASTRLVDRSFEDTAFTEDIMYKYNFSSTSTLDSSCMSGAQEKFYIIVHNGTFSGTLPGFLTAFNTTNINTPVTTLNFTDLENTLNGQPVYLYNAVVNDPSLTTPTLNVTGIYSFGAPTLSTIPFSSLKCCNQITIISVLTDGCSHTVQTSLDLPNSLSIEQHLEFDIPAYDNTIYTGAAYAISGGSGFNNGYGVGMRGSVNYGDGGYITTPYNTGGTTSSYNITRAYTNSNINHTIVAKTYCGAYHSTIRIGTNDGTHVTLDGFRAIKGGNRITSINTLPLFISNMGTVDFRNLTNCTSVQLNGVNNQNLNPNGVALANYQDLLSTTNFYSHGITYQGVNNTNNELVFNNTAFNQFYYSQSQGINNISILNGTNLNYSSTTAGINRLDLSGTQITSFVFANSNNATLPTATGAYRTHLDRFVLPLSSTNTTIGSGMFDMTGTTTFTFFGVSGYDTTSNLMVGTKILFKVVGNNALQFVDMNQEYVKAELLKSIDNNGLSNGILNIPFKGSTQSIGLTGNSSNNKLYYFPTWDKQFQTSTGGAAAMGFGTSNSSGIISSLSLTQGGVFSLPATTPGAQFFFTITAPGSGTNAYGRFTLDSTNTTVSSLTLTSGGSGFAPSTSYPINFIGDGTGTASNLTKTSLDNLNTKGWTLFSGISPAF